MSAGSFGTENTRSQERLLDFQPSLPSILFVKTRLVLPRVRVLDVFLSSVMCHTDKSAGMKVGQENFCD